MCTERNRRRGAPAAVAAAMATLAFAANAQDVGESDAAGDAGSAHAELRYRFEFVDDAAFAEDAAASTLRLRLNYETAAWRALSAFAEFDYVAELLADDFDSGGGTSPDRPQYPLVADPHGADLNQLYLAYRGIAGLDLRIGRQRILLDNQRFVGGVGWRQNEQTYDALALEYRGSDAVVLRYAYVTRVNRIFGDRSPIGRNDSATHLLNASFGLPSGWRVTPYVYRIDDDTPAFSSRTLGVRLHGDVRVGSKRLSLTAEAALQADAGNAPVDFDTHYLRLEAQLDATERLTLAAGIEELGGDDDTPGQSLRTPLATLHAFQGWADKFLSTPDAGVTDRFLGLRYSTGPWSLQVVAHDYAAADGARDWGRELDLAAERRFGERVALLLKAAFFEGDDLLYADTAKAWLMVTASY